MALIPLRKVVLKRIDGRVDERQPVEVKTYAEAAAAVARMSATAPVSGFHEVHFDLHFADEYVYEGVIELTPSHNTGYDVAEHVTNRCKQILKLAEGKENPGVQAKALIKLANKMLKGYDLTPLPSERKDEVVVASILDDMSRSLAERFSGILAPIPWSRQPRVYDESWLLPSVAPEGDVTDYQGDVDRSGKTFSIKPPGGKQ